MSNRSLSTTLDSLHTWWEKGWLPWILNAVLAVAIGYTFVGLITRDSSGNLRNIDVTQAQASWQQAGDIATIADRIKEKYLFGNLDQKAPPKKAPAPIVAPVSQLRLKVAGIYMSSEPNHSTAIISSAKNRREKLYLEGDKIQNNVILHAIYKDHVIVKHNGQLETLRLPSLSTASLLRRSTPAQQATPAPSSIPTGTPQEKTQTIRQIKKNPLQLTKLLQIDQHYKGGKMLGYRVRPQQNQQQLLNSFGLQSGDVVVSINGQSITDQNKMFAFMRRLNSLPSVQLTVLRNGQKVNLTIPLK